MHSAFHNFSYHRGIWHSILAGLLFWFLTAVIFHRLLGYHEGVAWLAGGFLFIGYLTHLILDEMYSVDVFDTRIKSSFGTAMKLYDAKRPAKSAAVALAAILAFAVTPPAKPFVDGISSQQLVGRAAASAAAAGQVVRCDRELGPDSWAASGCGGHRHRFTATGSCRGGDPAIAGSKAEGEQR